MADPVKHSPKALLPEFSLKDKVIVVSGGAQGLGLTQAEALLEAGATGERIPVGYDNMNKLTDPHSSRV